jgi:hypothetical protein
MHGVLHPDLSPLIGSWRLLSVVWTFSDTKESFEPLGSQPDGRMVLTSGGRIMFLLTMAKRRSPADDGERAALFNGMAAYTGFIRRDGPGRFVTSVDVAWHPDWVVDQPRFFTIAGDRLVIRSAEQAAPQYQGRLVVGDLIFIREH